MSFSTKEDLPKTLRISIVAILPFSELISFPFLSVAVKSGTMEPFGGRSLNEFDTLKITAKVRR